MQSFIRRKYFLTIFVEKQSKVVKNHKTHNIIEKINLILIFHKIFWHWITFKIRQSQNFALFKLEFLVFYFFEFHFLSLIWDLMSEAKTYSLIFFTNTITNSCIPETPMISKRLSSCAFLIFTAFSFKKKKFF